jgi:hypothetical protein
LPLESISLNAVSSAPDYRPVSMQPLPFDRRLDLQPGELVEIRSVAEISATLDADDKFEGIPFSLEMVPFCGQRVRVARRADFTCARGQPRQLDATVHLDEIRCDGSAHGQCQAGCLVLWKEAWLKRVPTSSARGATSANGAPSKAVLNGGCAFAAMMQKPDGTMKCQATELWSASRPSQLDGYRSYVSRLVNEYRAGRFGRTDLRYLFTYAWGKILLGAFKSWATAAWNADKYQKTPSLKLDLQPGEWVRVRSVTEILATLDRRGLNKGLEFKPEMFLFCGRKLQVNSRLQRLISESNGDMKNIRTSCILLEGVFCHGQRSLCARTSYQYWREIWLTRCSEN